MGGTGIAISDPYSVVQANPASYPDMKRTNFELSGVWHLVRQTTDERTVEHSNGRLLGFNIGIPFGDDRWGIALGVQPVTQVGYLIEDQGTLSNGGSVLYHYEGSGGLNRVFAGVGTAIWQKQDSLDNGHRLCIGGNFNYLFGTIEQTRKAYYPIGQGYFNTSLFNALNLSDPTGTFGLQFQGDLVRRRSKEVDGLRYMVGLTGELGTNLKAHLTDLNTTFVISNGVELTRDTINYDEGLPGNIFLPEAYAVGISVFNARWTVTAEARMRNWEDLNVEVEGYELHSSLGNNMTYALGAAWRPLGDRLGGTFWERTTYRFGFRYADDYVVAEGIQLTKMGASLGASLPLLGTMSRSRLTIGAEAGQRGTQENGLILERFVDVYIGLTFTPDLRESWFKKRRIE